jgi:hypothetical protein
LSIVKVCGAGRREARRAPLSGIYRIVTCTVPVVSVRSHRLVPIEVLGEPDDLSSASCRSQRTHIRGRRSDSRRPAPDYHSPVHQVARRAWSGADSSQSSRHADDAPARPVQIQWTATVFLRNLRTCGGRRHHFRTRASKSVVCAGLRNNVS